MRIAFCWQGYNDRKDKWRDGLFAAMQLLEKEHEVQYFDFPLTGMTEFNPDVVLYWEAPVTSRGKDADNWHAVCALPYKKCLLFAGGPLNAMDVKDFDLVFVESQINEEDCERQGIPFRRAFGVNTQIFRPQNLPKLYDGFMQATFASWKRHELFADALHIRGAVAGRKQEHDTNGYDRCVKQGVVIFDEQPVEEVARLINQSRFVVNTSEYWGGGQRCTLEAMACEAQVIVMSDSPKNREYVEEAGFGLVVEPNVEAIKMAIEELKKNPHDIAKARNYINSKWSESIYSTNLMEGIASIL